MKKIIILLGLLICLTAGISAQESDVIYIEGWVDIKDGAGEIYELFIGDRVYHGDTVITGEDGIAELEPEKGSRIIVNPDTVFSIKETDEKGTKRSMVSTTLGQVSFKFNRMTTEPLISTPSTVMGVRGTEFTVYAGSDGSSLVTVDSGAVEVLAGGESVLLSENEGVEVETGRSPGEKFEIKGKAIDFSEWDNGNIEAMLSAPTAGLSNIAAQLEKMIIQAEEWKRMYSENAEKLDELRKKMENLFSQDKDDEARAFYQEEIKPLEKAGLGYVMNYRYYSLSALSLRKHILGGFYVRMKTTYITDRNNPAYADFIEEYNEIIENYDVRISPMLVEADY
ncbi:MAG: FecR family protein [Spirochaetales bacterium]|uniref:FecR family protein n=1 Tax=Candidatus Thalassospirochaeta sargassi TaxID=3119039 RepID=A0AAJ1MKB4_9SPIO|nr:FecR family protein [Spirochaetales bacterium]